MYLAQSIILQNLTNFLVLSEGNHLYSCQQHVSEWGSYIQGCAVFVLTNGNESFFYVCFIPGGKLETDLIMTFSSDIFGYATLP